MTTDTRRLILEHNYAAMRRHGFQGVRADKEVTALGITKGALYYHFADKKALGYAVVEEMIAPHYLSVWAPLLDGETPVVAHIVRVLEQFKAHATDKEIALGCPLNNLIQEMSPLDEGFRQRLGDVVDGMHTALRTGLERAQATGEVTPLVDPSATAWFLLSSIEGAYGIAKVRQSRAIFVKSINHLAGYVRQLQIADA
ncbi:MAG: TetR/AcrR family transcriptional regulator [Catalinimonas sp.]